MGLKSLKYISFMFVVLVVVFFVVFFFFFFVVVVFFSRWFHCEINTTSSKNCQIFNIIQSRVVIVHWFVTNETTQDIVRKKESLSYMRATEALISLHICAFFHLNPLLKCRVLHYTLSIYIYLVSIYLRLPGSI